MHQDLLGKGGEVQELADLLLADGKARMFGDTALEQFAVHRVADRAHAEALNAKADALLAQYVPLADTLYEKMATQLRGEV